MSVETLSAGECLDGVAHGLETRLFHEDDVHVLHEVVHGQGARKAGGAVRGQHMARPGDIVAERGRGVAAAEHRTGVAHHGDECLIVGRLDLEVLGRDEIGRRPWPAPASR